MFGVVNYSTQLNGPFTTMLLSSSPYQRAPSVAVTDEQVYGLACLHAHVRLVDFEMSPSLAKVFPGPRFGVEGLRKLCGAPAGPLLCAVLKPVGRSVNELAEYAYSFAKGGMDVIKVRAGRADGRSLGAAQTLLLKSPINACSAPRECSLRRETNQKGCN